MRHVGTMMGNNSHQFILIHLHQFCWRDTLRHNDHRLIPKIYPGRDTSQFTDQAVGNLPHIIQTFFNRRLFQSSESLKHLIPCSHYRIGRIYFFTLYDTLNGTLKAFSLQQILLSEKNLCLGSLNYAVFFI